VLRSTDAHALRRAFAEPAKHGLGIDAGKLGGTFNWQKAREFNAVTDHGGASQSAQSVRESQIALSRVLSLGFASFEI